MGYGLASIKKGVVVKLTYAKEILALKDEIFANAQHTGTNFEIVRHAFSENTMAYGHPPPGNSLCRTGCIKEMNKILTNWINIFLGSGKKIDEVVKQGATKKVETVEGSSEKTQETVKPTIDIDTAINPASGGALLPIEDRRIALMEADWMELREKAIEVLGDDVFASINGKKPASRVLIVKALLEL